MSVLVSKTILRKYTVYTPQTNKTFELQALSVGDELEFKGSMLGQEQIAEHIAKVLYKSIVKFPEGISTFDDFINNVTTHDSQALFFGLYHVTYDQIEEYPISACPNCNTGFEVTIPTETLFHMTQYPEDKNILEERVEVELPLAKIKAIVKQPTLADEIITYKTSASFGGIHRELVKRLIIIEKFTKGSKETENIHDKLQTYKNLPAVERRRIEKAYNETFDKYKCDLHATVTCPHCGHKFKVNVNFADLFFRMVAE